MASNPLAGLTEDEYLALERAAETKSEFLHGEMFAKSGASFAHVALQGDLYLALGQRLGLGSCQAYGADLRVKVEATGLYTYPDIAVVCGQPQFAGTGIKDTLINPVVLWEVLSPSTQNYDRGDKFYHYRQIPTLREYVLVSQDRILVEHYRRAADNSWTLHSLDGGKQQLELVSIGVVFPVGEIYRRVKFDS